MNSTQQHYPRDPNPTSVPAGKNLAEAVSEFEANINIIRQTLKKTGGNKSQAARLLDIDFKTLQSKIKKYRIPVPARRNKKVL